MVNHKLLLLLMTTTLLCACATSPTGRKQLMLVSEDSAIQSSSQAYVQQVGQLHKEGKLSTDSKGVALAGAAAAALAVTLPNSRAAETEADRIGIELAAPENREKKLAALVEPMEVYYHPAAEHPVYALGGQPEFN